MAPDDDGLPAEAVANPQQHVRQFRDGLRRQREIYQGLTEISRLQAQVIQSGVTDEILSLARTKESELLRVAEIERSLAPTKKSWRTIRQRIDKALRCEVESELDQLEDILSQLIKLEAAGQQEMRQAQAETSAKLKQVEGGRRVQKAYGNNPSAARSRYLDRTE